MPAGLLVTVPVPVPFLAIDRENVCIVDAVVPQASGLYGELPLALNAFTRKQYVVAFIKLASV